MIELGNEIGEKMDELVNDLCKNILLTVFDICPEL